MWPCEALSWLTDAVGEAVDCADHELNAASAFTFVVVSSYSWLSWSFGPSSPALEVLRPLVYPEDTSTRSPRQAIVEKNAADPATTPLRALH